MRRIGNKRKALMTLGSLVIMFFISQVLFPNDLLAKSRESILRRGNVHIGISQEVDDIVCAQGNVVIEGHVFGSVFVVSGNILLKSTAVVDNNITLTDGDIWITKGARVKKGISTFGGKIHLEEGARVGGGIQEIISLEKLSEGMLSLMAKYIIMDRPLPPQSFNLAELSSLNLKQYGLRKKLERRFNLINIAGVGEVQFSPQVAEDAQELYYRKGRADIFLRVIKFNSKEDADYFWERLRELPESKMHNSVHVSLGDGAHWFFRHQHFTTCMWYRGRWFTYLDVSLKIPGLKRIERFWKESEELRDTILMEIERFYLKASQAGKKE